MTRFRALFVTVVVALLLQPVAATAAWQSAGAAAGTISATGVLRVQAPSVVQSESVVRIDWPATTLATGQPVQGYEVRRRAGTGSGAVVCTAGSSPSTCFDTAPTSGPVSYSVVAVFEGWRSQESPLTPYTHDDIKPATTATTNPAPTAAGWNSSPVTVTLDATDASGVASLSYRVDSGPWVSVSSSSATVPVAAEGVTTLTYRATDVFGNPEDPKVHVVRIDTVAPQASPTGLRLSEDTGSSPTDGITNDATQTLIGTAPAGSRVNVRVGAGLFGTVTTGQNGSFTAVLPALPADGVHDITARVVDLAGNEGPPATFVVRLDRTAPTTNTGFVSDGGSYKRGDFKSACEVAPWNVRDALCGSATDGAYSTGMAGSGSVTLVNSGGLCLRDAAPSFDAAACQSPLTVPLTGAGPFAWSLAVGNLPRDTYTLTVTLRDVAGNHSASGPVRFAVQ